MKSITLVLQIQDHCTSIIMHFLKGHQEQNFWVWCTIELPQQVTIHQQITLSIHLYQHIVSYIFLFWYEHQIGFETFLI